MKFTVWRILGLMGFTLLTGAISISADSVVRTNYSIPFAFTAGENNFPAGEYCIEKESSKGNKIEIKISSKDGKQTALVLARRVETDHQTAQTKLLFNQYAEKYFLTQLWGHDEKYAIKIPPTPAEHTASVELKAGGKQKPKTIAVSAKSS
jgi:hypothetical protein